MPPIVFSLGSDSQFPPTWRKASPTARSSDGSSCRSTAVRSAAPSGLASPACSLSASSFSFTAAAGGAVGDACTNNTLSFRSAGACIVRQAASPACSRYANSSRSPPPLAAPWATPAPSNAGFCSYWRRLIQPRANQAGRPGRLLQTRCTIKSLRLRVARGSISRASCLGTAQRQTHLRQRRLGDGGAHGGRHRGADARRQIGKLAPQTLLNARRQLLRQALAIRSCSSRVIYYSGALKLQ